MKSKRNFIMVCIAPALISFLIFFLYPVLRTFLVSFYKVKGVADAMSLWEYAGFSNYIYLKDSPLFIQSFINMFKIWFIGGIITIFFAMIFAVILTSGVRFKVFWRSLIYLPNTISAVAMATMWTQYVYNNQDFGLFKRIFRALGIRVLADIQWTAPQFIFTSMLIAFCFGSVGYYMLILLAGMEGIPKELYEASKLDGASLFVQFTKITLPLIRNVFRTCIVLWTIAVINFFVWAQMFSPWPDPNTITPVYFMYSVVFGVGTEAIPTDVNVGMGAGVGVILTIVVVVLYGVINLLIRERKLEY